MKVSAGTIARTIILALALINQVLTATGHNVINVSDEDINTLISTIFTVGAAIVAWWKTNGFTKAGIKGEQYIKELKAESKEG